MTCVFSHGTPVLSTLGDLLFVSRPEQFHFLSFLFFYSGTSATAYIDDGWILVDPHALGILFSSAPGACSSGCIYSLNHSAGPLGDRSRSESAFSAILDL